SLREDRVRLAHIVDIHHAPRKWPHATRQLTAVRRPVLSGVPSCQFTALLISLDGRPSDQIQPIVGEQECRARLLIGNFLADPFNVKMLPALSPGDECGSTIACSLLDTWFQNSRQ